MEYHATRASRPCHELIFRPSADHYVIGPRSAWEFIRGTGFQPVFLGRRHGLETRATNKSSGSVRTLRNTVVRLLILHSEFFTLHLFGRFSLKNRNQLFPRTPRTSASEKPPSLSASATRGRSAEVTISRGICSRPRPPSMSVPRPTWRA